MSVPPPSRPLQRPDTSICSHLSALISGPESNGDIAVKLEPVDNDSGSPSAASGSLNVKERVEKRFADVVRWAAQDQGVKRKKTCGPRCHSCDTSMTAPYACLACSFVGCMPLAASSSTAQNCMAQHWSQSGTCGFAVYPGDGSIWCAECDDMTYPDHFESLAHQIRLRVEEENDTSVEQSAIKKGRGRGEYRSWKNSGRPTGNLSEVTEAPCTGLRGILNLSQTCFLSAILQALIHNPLLKAYFLSDKHNRHICTNGSKGLLGGKPYMGPEKGVPTPERERGCMCCELDQAFEEFHGDDKVPFGPVTMLYTMWHASAELEGYGQQDAHSFFLAALDQIHAHAKGQLSSCNCIAHQTFSGSLLSAVTCSKCKTTSSTIDPILDIQLDFPLNAEDDKALTLTNLLRKFCAEEKVGDVGRGYDCSSCGGGEGVAGLRKLQIKKLPPVLSFQLKRFAHNATSTKVELPVHFPSHIDMSPFVETLADDTATLPRSLYEYDLFAVVTHEGKLDNGHYWADVLSGDNWYHCDDDKVTATTLKEVLAQKAYMLFYVKRTLAYAQPMSRMLAANGTNGVLDKAPPSLEAVSRRPSQATSIIEA